MDAGTIFSTVSLMVLANGAVLANIYRDLPDALRPAAWHWQIGTLLVAFGCGVFAFGTQLPLWAMVTLANGALMSGLIVYFWALQRFYGQEPSARDLIVAAATTVCIFLLSAVYQYFLLRVFIISIAWLWIMGRSMRLLASRSQTDPSRSRRMLMALYGVAMIYVAVRFLLYTRIDIPADFTAATGNYFVNLISPIVMALLPAIGTTAFVLMCTDQVRRQLEIAASTDYLTGLPNRRFLMKHGEARFDRARRQKSGFAAAILDLDGFKSINDGYGHDAGDAVLVEVTARLRRAARHGDLIARSGGEEFVVLLDGLTEAAAFQAIERMRLAVAAEAVSLDGVRLSVTTSIGVAVVSPGDGSFETLLRRADRALYRAKDAGKNRVILAAAA